MSTNPGTTQMIPNGFIQVESKLTGVTVYAPAPVQDTRTQDRVFICPNCGATTNYNPDDESVTCSYCGYSQKIDAQVVGKDAQASEFTVQVMAEQSRGWGGERRQLHCESCGADISLAPDDLSATCPFCASNQIVAQTLPKDMIRPGFLVPFKVDTKECASLSRDWLGKGWMHPSGLASVASSARYSGIYLPFWTFSAQIDAQWQAEVGYERTESYYDAGSKSWRTRTVIDWRWESGKADLPIHNLLSSGSRQISTLLLKKIYPFDLNALAEYDPGFLAGLKAKSYDIPLDDAWSSARGQMREMSKDACRSAIHSNHVRNFSMNADFSDETWRFILLPVYIAAYRFGEKGYQVMVNGQSGKVAGQKPVAWRKVLAVILLALLPGLIAGLVGMLQGSSGGTALALGIFLFLAGIIADVIILRQAMQAGEA